MPEFNAAFKKWFGASRVVDTDGNPFMVYHGSPVLGFTKFQRSRDLGFHFGTMEQAFFRLSDVAQEKGFKSVYELSAEEWLQQGYVRRFYLSLQNPIELEDIGGWDDAINVAHEILHKSKIDVRGSTIPEIRAALTRLGYDGVIYENETEGSGESFLAFYPEQIKSANQNDGTWDADDPDIRSNPVPETFWGRAGAGILLHCADDDTYLLTLRSGDVEQPGTWGIPGGACSGEGFYTGAEGRAVSKKQAWECAVRETLEELGWLPKHPGAVQPVVFKRGNFRYTTFVVEVSGEEKAASRGISLNWENDDFSWLTPDDLSAMSNELHFGALFVLDKLGVTRA